jgi:hypothetical protein
MELVIAGIVAVVLLLLIGGGSVSRRTGDAAELETKAFARGADVERQFERTRHDGDLL